MTARRTAAASLLGAVLGLDFGLLASVCTAQGTVPRGFQDSLVVGSLSTPASLAFLPDGRLLFTEQRTARIRLIVNRALAATDPVGIVGQVNASGGEQGLLGIAVDPGWPARPYLYVHSDHAGDNKIRISRFSLTGDLGFTGNGSLLLDPTSRFDLLTDIPDNAGNHNGGTLRFGPDGMLYASLGEDATPCAAQDTVSLRGVILRLDVSRLSSSPGGPAPKALLAAAGNPFASHPDSNARLVWTLGLRNPFRFHIDPTGALFIADVGQSAYEEIDRVDAPGTNLGWPLFEGPAPGGSCSGVSGTGMTGPIYAYNRSGFTAAVISAGYYPGVVCILAPCGTFPPEYGGDYFFSDYYVGFLRRLKRTGDTWSLAPPVAGQPNASDWGTGFDEVSDYLVGPDGGLWYCRQSYNFAGDTGEIRRIVHAPSAPPPPPAPTNNVSFDPPYPSPARGAVTFTYTLSRAARVELEIYDTRGVRVRRLLPRTDRVAGGWDEFWDGHDDDGHAARPGLYFARLTVDGMDLTRRFPLMP